MKPRCVGLHTWDELSVLHVSPGRDHGFSLQCNPHPTGNVPPGINGHTSRTGSNVWQATAGATPYLGTSTGPTAATPGRNTTNKTRAGGHPPPKNQTPHGPLPQAVQQLCEHPQDPHGIRKAHVGPPHPTKILPPKWPILLVLELCVGEMFPRTSVQVCPGPLKKGRIHGLVCRQCH